MPALKLLSRSRPDVILARIVILTMIVLIISYLIFGIVTAWTTDKGKLFQGKLVIAALAILLGTAAAWLVPVVATSIYKQLDLIID